MPGGTLKNEYSQGILLFSKKLAAFVSAESVYIGNRGQHDIEVLFKGVLAMLKW